RPRPAPPPRTASPAVGGRARPTAAPPGAARPVRGGVPSRRRRRSGWHRFAASVGEAPRVVECVCDEATAEGRLERGRGGHPAAPTRAPRPPAAPRPLPRLPLDPGTPPLPECLRRCLHSLRESYRLAVPFGSALAAASSSLIAAHLRAAVLGRHGLVEPPRRSGERAANVFRAVGRPVPRGLAFLSSGERRPRWPLTEQRRRPTMIASEGLFAALMVAALALLVYAVGLVAQAVRGLRGWLRRSPAPQGAQPRTATPAPLRVARRGSAPTPRPWAGVCP